MANVTFKLDMKRIANLCSEKKIRNEDVLSLGTMILGKQATPENIGEELDISGLLTLHPSNLPEGQGPIFRDIVSKYIWDNPKWFTEWGFVFVSSCLLPSHHSLLVLRSIYIFFCFLACLPLLSIKSRCHLWQHQLLLLL